MRGNLVSGHKWGRAAASLDKHYFGSALGIWEAVNHVGRDSRPRQAGVPERGQMVCGALGPLRLLGEMSKSS